MANTKLGWCIAISYILSNIPLVFSADHAPAVGFIGLGITLYQPLCPTTCHNILSRAELACSTDNHDGKSSHGHTSAASAHRAADFKTSPACWASDTSYLTSLAYCISDKCSGVLEHWQLEQFWAENAVGSGVSPTLTYGQALAEAMAVLDGDEARTWNRGVLNFTGTANESRYDIVYGSFDTYEYAERKHTHYGLILLLTGAGIPVLIALASHLPTIPTLTDLITPYLDTSLIRNYNVRILPYHLGNPLTIGQFLYITTFLLLNILLSALSYRTQWPHRMYQWAYVELHIHIANRTGVLAFAIFPLVVLTASRNNILLHLTNWSHATFILLHRWIGRVFILQSVIHSIVELYVFARMGRYPAEESKPYWIWGVVATMAAVAVVFFSTTWMRRNHYEIFLVGHIVLVIFVLIGSWYHVQILYRGARGYENWLLICVGLWVGDRAWRILRICQTGVTTSTVTELGGGVVRVDVEGVRWSQHPGSHGYVYFPGLSWRVWENHPFSVVPTSMLRERRPVCQQSPPSASAGSAASGIDTPSSSASASSGGMSVGEDIEKKAPSVAVTALTSSSSSSSSRDDAIGTTAGMTLFIRRGKGLTRHIRPTSTLRTLLEGPYHSNAHTHMLATSDRLVCIAGGVGITGVLPFVAGGVHGNVKLYWSVREGDRGMVEEVERSGALEGWEREVRIGEAGRFVVRDLLEREGETGVVEGGKVGVLVCGPPGMCDEVRAVVTGLGRRREGAKRWEVGVEAFSW